MEATEKKSEDDIFLEALGGWKAGKVYGLGSAADMFYERPKSDNKDAKKARIDHVRQLESQVEQLTSENMQLKTNLTETKEGLEVTTEKLEQTNQNVKTLQEQFQLILNGQLNASINGGLSS